MEVLKEIRDWSEVWGLLIPIFVLLVHKNLYTDNYLKPVVLYIWIALLLNVMIDVIWKFKIILNLPEWLRTNNYLYNIHSIVRFMCFSWFFRLLQQPMGASKY